VVPQVTLVKMLAARPAQIRVNNLFEQHPTVLGEMQRGP
jgi:hypothetical protein